MTNQAPDAPAQPASRLMTVGLREPVYKRVAELQGELENARNRKVSYSEIIGELMDVYREVGG